MSSWDEAFDLWIGRGRPAYVERYKLSPEEAIQLLRRSGGLPVLAHPYIYSRSGERKAGLDLKHWLPRLREAGLEGIEVYYPNYPRRVSRQLAGAGRPAWPADHRWQRLITEECWAMDWAVWPCPGRCGKDWSGATRSCRQMRPSAGQAHGRPAARMPLPSQVIT